MAHIPEPPPWLLHWSRRRIGAAACVAVVLGFGGIALAPPLVDALLGAGILGSGGIAAWAWGRRSALHALPLQLGDVAVRQVVLGEPALRVRCWLGHGRVMRQIEARAQMLPGSGPAVPLVVELPTRVATGPLTLTVRLPPLAFGEIALTVAVREGDRGWEASRTYPLADVGNGPLDAPVRWIDGRLAWDRAGWDRKLSGR